MLKIKMLKIVKKNAKTLTMKEIAFIFVSTKAGKKIFAFNHKNL